MNLQDALNAVTAGGSDYAGAKKLGINRQAFSNYRNGRRVPDDEILEKIIEVTDLEAHQVYLAAYAERLENTEVAEHFRAFAS